MIIEQTFTVNASREKTAEFFFDIDRVAPCIAGVQDVEEIEPGRYQAVLGVRLGPIRAAFKGTITLDDTEAPARLKASGEGRDRATGSVAKVAFSADLAELEPGVTTVQAQADLALRGRMSQFGTGVIRAAAGEIVQEFATCANAKLAGQQQSQAAEIGAGAADQTPPDRAAGPAPAPRGVVSLVLRGVLRSIVDGIQKLGRRLRQLTNLRGER